MMPWLTHQFGNAASRDHTFGWDAAEAVEEARHHVACLVNANSNEIFFTGSEGIKGDILLYFVDVMAKFL